MADQGKVAIITGGAKGIGEGCTRVFCGAGWRVVIPDYDEKNGVALAKELNAKGPGEVHYELADMRKEEDIRRVVDSGREALWGAGRAREQRGLASPHPSD